MISLAAPERGGRRERPALTDVSVARSLLDRADLLLMLDGAVGKRVTVISAPAGSGKTSLLRAWAEQSAGARRVAFVTVDRDEQHAERFWSAVLGAISPERSVEPGDQLVDGVVSEIAEQAEPVVLIIDDLHELKSAEALAQLEHLLAILPSSTRLV